MFRILCPSFDSSFSLRFRFIYSCTQQDLIGKSCHDCSRNSSDGVRVVAHVKFDLNEFRGHASSYWAHWVSRQEVHAAHAKFVNDMSAISSVSLIPPLYPGSSRNCDVSCSFQRKGIPFCAKPKTIARCGH